MAPFNTHFLVAEQLWPELDQWHDHYGQFCFGCAAPDVDKLSARLTQKDTHFSDRQDDYELMVTHRSVRFLQQQATFLSQPFAELSPAGQAFTLGYLCHLCVDEVSKHQWRGSTWGPVLAQNIDPTSAFAALDELARQQLQDYPAVAEALQQIEPLPVMALIQLSELEILLAGLIPFVTAPDTEAEFMAIINLFSNRDPANLRRRREKFWREIEIARQSVHHFNVTEMVTASVKHSRRRFADLIAGRLPEPGYPD